MPEKPESWKLCESSRILMGKISIEIWQYILIALLTCSKFNIIIYTHKKKKRESAAHISLIIVFYLNKIKNIYLLKFMQWGSGWWGQNALVKDKIDEKDLIVVWQKRANKLVATLACSHFLIVIPSF